MKFIGTLIAAALLAFGVSGTAKADGHEAVTAFYAYLSAPNSKEAAAAVEAGMAEDWVSIGDYSGAEKTRDAFIKQIAGFGQLIPDMTWKIEEMIVAGDRVIVRGRASGTPKGPLFGVDGKGKSFEIMSIDIHTLKDGKVVRTYHVEDWAGALRQLSAD